MYTNYEPRAEIDYRRRNLAASYGAGSGAVRRRVRHLPLRRQERRA
jgi:hypothetical protein